MRILHAIPASGGIAIGPAYQFKKDQLAYRRYFVSDKPFEIQRLENALEKARRETVAVLEKARAGVNRESASIFEAQAMMLEDPDYISNIREKIDKEALNAEAAVADATEEYARLLDALADEYLRARAVDIREVGLRLVRNLSGQGESFAHTLNQPAIILAEEMTPLDTISLNKHMVLGFCTVRGGPTAHVAILARELGIPALVGAGEEILSIPDGCQLALDGSEGTLLVDPDTASLTVKRKLRINQSIKANEAAKMASEAALTQDGHQVKVVANIANIESAELALESGAEGVGLLRTEFLYLERESIPDEEEQYQAYRAILDVFGARPVILRTLDIGGDKGLPYLNLPEETNPFLGLRAIRLCLAKPEIFKPQLKAALRAGINRNLKLMFPMVATIGEVRAARSILEECRSELAALRLPIVESIEVGIMVETPAAAIMVDQLAEVVDFFSIGTNDLSQYTMAADRTSSSVSALPDAFQPAVLRLVRDVVQAAHRRGKWVSICGELAGDRLAVPLLLGLGLDELSVNPALIPHVKQTIRSLTLEEARQIAENALNLASPDQIRDMLRTTAQL